LEIELTIGTSKWFWPGGIAIANGMVDVFQVVHVCMKGGTYAARLPISAAPRIPESTGIAAVALAAAAATVIAEVIVDSVVRTTLSHAGLGEGSGNKQKCNRRGNSDG
jgi:hypothetical protein